MKLLHKSATKRNISFFFIGLMIVQLVGCRSYYDLSYVPKENFKNIKSGKIFVLHAGDKLYSFKEVKADSVNLYGIVCLINEDIYYLEGKSDRYRMRESTILNEVHVFMADNDRELQLGYTEIPFSDISKIVVIDQDRLKTFGSFMLGFAVVVSVIVAIMAITISSGDLISGAGTQ